MIQPCLNEGICSTRFSNQTDKVEYFCACPNGFVGEQCEYQSNLPLLALTRIEKSLLAEPLDRTNYSKTIGRHLTSLPVLWTQPLNDACASMPCQNNGTCINLAYLRVRSVFTCVCQRPFHGPLCQLRDACFSNPCSNNGVCYLMPENKYLCKCYVGFNGTNCENNLNLREIAPRCPRDFCRHSGNCKIRNQFSIKSSAIAEIKRALLDNDYGALRAYFECECLPNKIGANCESGWSKKRYDLLYVGTGLAG